MPLTRISSIRPRSSQTSAFWKFSLRLYGLKGVAEACLDLQDRRGLDVNLILFCCWRAEAGLKLGPADIARAERQVKAWRTAVIQPLRRLRRRLKEDALGMPEATVAQLRRQIVRVELEAERVAQDRLQRLPAPASGPGLAPSLAADNLRAYFVHAGLTAGRFDRRALATLSAACRASRPRARPSA